MAEPGEIVRVDGVWHMVVSIDSRYGVRTEPAAGRMIRFRMLPAPAHVSYYDALLEEGWLPPEQAQALRDELEWCRDG